jgi:flagellar biosynthetic protein FlhB
MSSERTEKATPKRRAEARGRGQIARSEEVASLFALTGGFAVLALMGPTMLDRFEQSMRTGFAQISSPDLQGGALSASLDNALTTLLGLCAPIFAVAAVMAVAASVLQNRPRLTATALKPDVKRLNPLTGVKRLVSAHSLVDLVKSVIKLVAVGGICFLTIYPRLPDLVALGNVPPTVAMRIVGSLVLSLGWRTLAVLAVLTAADIWWSRHAYEKSLRMSKEEVKQEAKQQDMPSEVKGKLRQRARQMARARMLGNVRLADVVVTNPTHFAVALRYRPDEGAPRVLAKGTDLLALRIRELADEHDVAIVEDRPLARLLYAQAEVGEFVPAEAFGAVAEVLAFVWRTSRRRRQFAWA